MSMEQEVQLAKQGDREAFIRLMRQMEQGLYNTARAMVKKDEDIADALQETILKAYKSLDTLREPSFFKTWVFRILINECSSILKKRSRSVTMEALPETQDTSDNMASVELRMAVDKLEDQQRIVVVLYYFQDMPLKQVADTLQISESAVKTRLYRARKTLMEEIQPAEEGKMNHESI
ncbi:RNA polymerase sigma-70 factor, ECF subfamily [Paenibacillus sophorae]|uniref:RNA polymerase sigma-70 factor, ECF subfamily n=2 Tax=Paenibacillus sophorae TaxID=1333845 RepID=A0A1H8F9G6_9BACL|nr:sigma-70 family RNA polymerase sigma factor [Paenibacillus sophorae]QWU13801.1 sigma-70 family RNA polymerase sigma factor [Paenibacillus sophorae]SEN28196.1 RNA polymerase sigma-70 factor, ECF subfamily [Paenibacillus sophorae]